MSEPSSFSRDIPPLASTLEALAGDRGLCAAIERVRVALDGLRLDTFQASVGARLSVAFAEARASCAVEDLIGEGDVPLRWPTASSSRPTSAPLEHVLSCRQALFAGAQAIPSLPICRRLAEAVAGEATGREMGLRRAPGTALRRVSDGQIVYTPPVGEPRIAALLADWEAAVNDARHDPILQAAVGHGQFEIIHPFVDGNGRTGRVLVLLQLMAGGLLAVPCLCLSDIILRRRDSYYRLLLGLTQEGSWTRWTAFMLEVVEEAATWTQRLLRSFPESAPKR